MYMCAYLLLTHSINLVLCHVPCTAGHTGFFLQTRLLLLRTFTSLMCVLPAMACCPGPSLCRLPPASSSSSSSFLPLFSFLFLLHFLLPWSHLVQVASCHFFFLFLLPASLFLPLPPPLPAALVPPCAGCLLPLLLPLPPSCLSFPSSSSSTSCCPGPTLCRLPPAYSSSSSSFLPLFSFLFLLHFLLPWSHLVQVASCLSFFLFLLPASRFLPLPPPLPAALVPPCAGCLLPLLLPLPPSCLSFRSSSSSTSCCPGPTLCRLPPASSSSSSSSFSSFSSCFTFCLSFLFYCPLL